VKKARKKLEKGEGLARIATPGFMIPANAFEIDVGDFWGIAFARRSPDLCWQKSIYFAWAPEMAFKKLSNTCGTC
jgi:hypothetical protein